MSRTCETCTNFHPTGKTEVFREDHGYIHVVSGQCRIKPPEATGSVDDRRWPLVLVDEWCGLYLARDHRADAVTPAPAVLPFPQPLEEPPAILRFPGVK